jgi:hypothetical protein
MVCCYCRQWVGGGWWQLEYGYNASLFNVCCCVEFIIIIIHNSQFIKKKGGRRTWSLLEEKQLLLDSMEHGDGDLYYKKL